MPSPKMMLCIAILESHVLIWFYIIYLYSLEITCYMYTYMHIYSLLFVAE